MLNLTQQLLSSYLLCSRGDYQLRVKHYADLRKFWCASLLTWGPPGTLSINQMQNENGSLLSLSFTSGCFLGF